MIRRGPPLYTGVWSAAIDKATRADVARHAGVAESTVSRALNDSPLITEAIKAKVRESARRLGYIPSRQAALFARKKTCTIGLVVPEYEAFPTFSRPYFPALLDGVVLGAEERGYSVMIVPNKVGRPASELFALVSSKTVDGLVFAVTPADCSPFLDLVEAGVPFVLINNYYEGLSSVDAIPRSGMRMAFSHAYNLGHRMLGYITGDKAFRNAIDRLQAFESLCGEFGMGSRIVEGDFSRSSGYRGAGRLLDSGERPSLIMTSSDRAAFGVLAYCAEKGLSVPRDLSVIGYDNLFPAQDVMPALSTVDNPVSTSGAVGVRLLIDFLEGGTAWPVQKWLETGFVVRESTARAADFGPRAPPC
ncbi:MAG: LacI family DNA-binding transcriptional regulator [Treponema sp.]|nr:LacI family DNA-binding transcriptional regulator [Treponema sp.]